MKVSLPRFTNDASSKKPLLPLVPEDPEELTGATSRTFLLRTNPADPDCSKYKFQARVIQGKEDVRTILRWFSDCTKICSGHGATTFVAQEQLYLTVLDGAAKTVFLSSVVAAAKGRYDQDLAAAADANARNTITQRTMRPANRHYNRVADIAEAAGSVIINAIPSKTLQRVKRYLRRDCRKPAGMLIRTFYQHLIHINGTEIPLLPPFADDQSLSNDEIVDILLFATPKSWQKEMDRQGFDPVTRTPQEVVDFMERIETAEDFDGKPVSSNGNGNGHSSNGKKSSKKKSKTNGSPNSDDQKHCMLHGWGGHATEDCFKLKAEAQRLKGGSSSGGSTNKTWKNKAKDGKDKAKKDLATLIKKQVDEKVKKELASLEKKRKSNEVNAMELDDDKLQQFNYDNMSVDDDISV